MPESLEFQYDVFLSHSAKDKVLVRPLAERLWQDGLYPKAEGRTRKAEMEFQPSAFGPQPLLPLFGSDWAQLEAGTCGWGNCLERRLAVRAPLNQQRLFMSELQPFSDAPSQVPLRNSSASTKTGAGTLLRWN